jgi:hypothetical protein
MIYRLISDEIVDATLEFRPTQLWTLVTVEVIVRVAGQRYLAVTCPSYRSGFEHAAWAVPFQGWPVTSGTEWGMPSTISALRNAFSAGTSPSREEDVLNSCIYHYGLTGSRLTRLPEFIEIKDSPRDPGVIKAYRIIRWYATQLPDLALSNLVDIHGIMNIGLLPLREASSGNFMRFRGHDLLTNVQHVAKFHAQSNSSSGVVTPDHFLSMRRGIVVRFDLAGYGAACKFCTERMGTFMVDGQGAWAEFTREFHWRLFTELERVGISEMQFTGDGFNCAIELKNSDANQEAIGQVLALHLLLCQFVDTWANPRIEQTDLKLGSRMAVHVGEYRYGKIGLAASFAPQLDGKSIVEACRMEAALRTELVLRQLQKGHYIVFSELAEAILETSGVNLAQSYSRIDKCELREKEFSTFGSIFWHK